MRRFYFHPWGLREQPGNPYPEKRIKKKKNLLLDDSPDKNQEISQHHKTDPEVLKKLCFSTYFLGHQGRGYWEKKCSISWPMRAEKKAGGSNKLILIFKDEIMVSPWSLKKMKRKSQIIGQPNVCPEQWTEGRPFMCPDSVPS